MLEYAWYPVLLFITTPIFLHRLGAEQYGLWMLLSAAVGFGGVLSGGTGAATIKEVSAACGNGGRDNVEIVIRSSLAIALVGGGLLAAVIASVFWFLGDILFQKMGNPHFVRLTGTFAALLVWIDQLDGVFASALKGAEQFGRSARIEMAGKTVQIGAAMAAVLIWADVSKVYDALLIVALSRLAVRAGIASKVLRLVSLYPKWSTSADFLGYAKWGWLQGIGGLLFGIADRVLIGSFLGAASLAHYSVASQLALQIHASSAAGLSVLFPIISRKIQAGSELAVRRIIKLAIAANFVGSGTLALGLLLFGREILTLWLGEVEANASAQVLSYLTIAYWLLAINTVPHYVLLGIGRIRFVALANLTAGCVLIIASIALVQPYGIQGIAVARIVYGVIILVNFIALIEFWRRKREAPFNEVDAKPSVEGI